MIILSVATLPKACECQQLSSKAWTWRDHLPHLCWNFGSIDLVQDKHSCHEFISVPVLQCLKGRISQHLFPHFGSYFFFPAPSSAPFSKPWIEGLDTNVPFRAEHSVSYVFLFQSFYCLYLDVSHREHPQNYSS